MSALGRPNRPNAIDATPYIERSDDLLTWFRTENTGFMTFVETTTDNDGTPLHTYRTTAPLSAAEVLFLRLGADY